MVQGDVNREPDHELDRSVDPGPAEAGPRDSGDPTRPTDVSGEAPRAPRPEDADEGKDTGDISTAPIV